MGNTSSIGEGRRIGVTGATSDLGQLLMPLLLADERVEKVVAFDVAMPLTNSPRVTFQRVDLTSPASEATLTQACTEHRLDTLYHLAFISSKVHNAAFAHELEVLGSMHVLAAAGQKVVKRLVVPSLTALYGASADAPAYSSEYQRLRGCKNSRYINDKVEVEEQLRAFRERTPDVAVVVLRFAPLVGRVSNNPLTRLLKTRLIPTVLGFDPLWQLIHEDDAAAALHRALDCPAGVFNLAAPGVLPFSSLVQRSGGQVMPLPLSALRSLIAALEAIGRSSVPVPLLDYLRYSWLADAGAGEAALDFQPRYSIGEAVQSLGVRERT